MAETRLTQKQVDEVKLRALTQLLVTHVTKLKDPNPPVYHLRFPKPHDRAYALKLGNPPPNVSRKDVRVGEPMSDQWRFPWEMGLNLVCHLPYIKPETAIQVWQLVHDMQASGGNEPAWDMELVRQHAFKMLKGEAPMDVPDVPHHIMTPAEVGMMEDIERQDVIDLIRRRTEKAVKRITH